MDRFMNHTVEKIGDRARRRKQTIHRENQK